MDSVIRTPAPNLLVPNVEVNVERLRELYAWIEALATDTCRASLSEVRYGIVFPPDGGTAFLLDKMEDRLLLLNCYAFTSRGARIVVQEGVTPSLSLILSDHQLQAPQAYRVLVRVEDAVRTPFGPEATDLPARKRFSWPTYSLEIQPESTGLHEWSNVLPIGRLIHDSREWQMDASYLPPCYHIAAHPRLIRKHAEYLESLRELLRKLPEAIQQVSTFQDRALYDLREFLVQAGCFLAGRMAAFEQNARKGSPYQLVNLWQSFAAVADFLINSLSRYRAFYRLLHENLRTVDGVFFTPERFSGVLSETAKFEYKHDNLAASLQITDRFLSVFVPVVKALSLGPLSIQSPDAENWVGADPRPDTQKGNQISSW